MVQKRQETKRKITDLLLRVLNCYNDDGTLSEEYYNNLHLEELTEEEIRKITKFAFEL